LRTWARTNHPAIGAVADGARAFVYPQDAVQAEVMLSEATERRIDIDGQIAARSSNGSADEEWLARAKAASRFAAEDVRRLEKCLAIYKNGGLGDVYRERSAAQSSCAAMAAEIARLQEECSVLRTRVSSARVSVAFVEVAEMVLAEQTYNRIRARALDRAASDGGRK
jgi:hypothetical protein